MKPSRILITLTAFLLILSLSASVLAAQPKQGVYVKQDSAGKISALMYVISKQGKGPLASAANELSITLEALDDQGNVTEQLVSDYVEGEAAVAGTGLEGLIFPIRTVWSPEAAAQNWTALMYMMEVWNVMLLFRP